MSFDLINYIHIGFGTKYNQLTDQCLLSIMIFGVMCPIFIL